MRSAAAVYCSKQVKILFEPGTALILSLVIRAVNSDIF